jgi:hypothetical protein
MSGIVELRYYQLVKSTGKMHLKHANTVPRLAIFTSTS